MPKTAKPRRRDASVRRVRARLDLTQRQFAELLGVSVPAVQRWEAGREIPTSTAGRILTLAQARLRNHRGGTSPVVAAAIRELLNDGKPLAALVAFLSELA